VAVRKFLGTGSILNVKKIRKHLDENDAASVLVFHSVEENPQMSLRNRVLQTGIDFFYHLLFNWVCKQQVDRVS
jgi:tRNA-dihydrouridine synthase